MVQDNEASSLSEEDLVALCHEIDESWNAETLRPYRERCYLTDKGFVMLEPRDGTVFINMLAVLPQHRGTGHGRDLVRMVEDIARSVGIRRIAVDALHPEFFQKLGFKIDSVLPGHASGRDITIMHKEIPNVEYSQTFIGWAGRVDGSDPSSHVGSTDGHGAERPSESEKAHP